MQQILKVAFLVREVLMSPKSQRYVEKNYFPKKVILEVIISTRLSARDDAFNQPVNIHDSLWAWYNRKYSIFTTMHDHLSTPVLQLQGTSQQTAVPK